MIKALPLMLVFLGAAPILAFSADSTEIVLPGNVDNASSISRKFQEDQEKTVQILTAPEISPLSQPPAKTEVSEKKFWVDRLEWEGNQVVPDAEIEHLLRDDHGKLLTLPNLRHIAGKITKHYQSKGFLASLAYVPPQDFQKIVLIKILEGKVGNVIFEGIKYSSQDQLRKWVTLKPGEILRREDILLSVRQMNITGLEVSPRLKRGTVPGTSDVVFLVHDRFPVKGSLQFDNAGTETSGKKRFYASLAETNLTKHNDSLTTSTLFARDLGFLITRYYLPIPETGTEISAGFNHGHVTPQKQIKQLAINSIAQNYSLDIQQRLFRKNQTEVSVAGGFNISESRIRWYQGTYERERLRVLKLSPILKLTDSWGGTQWKQDFGTGLDFLGATIYHDPASRQGVKAHFFKYAGQLTRQFTLPWDLSSQVQFFYQQSTGKLPAQQQMALGGSYSVRGYPESDYLADSALVLRSQFLIPPYGLPAAWKLPWCSATLRDQLRFIAFQDQGYGWVRGTSPSEIPYRQMISVGGGFAFQLSKRLSALFEWGYALGDRPLTDHFRHQFHFRVNADL